MIDIGVFSNIILIAVALVSLVAVVVTIRELVSGSYKRYSEKRMLHLEQLHRIQQELRKGEDHG